MRFMGRFGWSVEPQNRFELITINVLNIPNRVSSFRNGSPITVSTPTLLLPIDLVLIYLDSTTTGSQTTNSQPKTDGISSKPFPTNCKFKLFKNPKMVGEIEMGSKESIPCVNCSSDRGDGEDDNADAMLAPCLLGENSKAKESP